MAKGLSKEYWAIKDRERPKYKPSRICAEMNRLGYPKFKQHLHTKLWQEQDAKAKGKDFGIDIEGTWYWYENWFQFVKKHCEKNKSLYS